MTNACSAPRFRYPYEEFAGHLKAMPTVRQWEYTSRFGHLGSAQTSRASSARIIEYFLDSYQDWREAIHKAEILLSICDFIGCHADFFQRSGLIERQADGVFSVESALLRAVHQVFAFDAQPGGIKPSQVLTLARTFQANAPTE